MWYIYPSMVALSTNGEPVASGTGQIYAETDTAGTTPLEIRDVNGLTITSVQIGDNYLTQAFLCETPESIWRSGGASGIAVPLSSPKGLRQAAENAAEAAQNAELAATIAQAAATVAAEAAEDAAAGGGGGSGGGLGNSVVMPRWNGTGAEPTRTFPDGHPLAGTPIPVWVSVRWRQPTQPVNALPDDEWRRTGV